MKHIESSHVFLVNKREINDNTDSMFCLNNKNNYLEKFVLKYLRIEKKRISEKYIIQWNCHVHHNVSSTCVVLTLTPQTD